MGKFSKVVLESSEVLSDGTIRTEDDDCIFYKKNGEFHRTDGPAFIDIYTGEEKWYLNGKLHRVDGPAIRYKDIEEWYLHGKRHRTNGPAVMYGDTKEYWVNGRFVHKDNFDKHFGEE